MKILALICALTFVTVAPKSVYEFKLKSIEGKAFSLAQYKGKKVLIVNTASKCGFTPQYAELQKLAEQYKDKVVVVGFPANNFGQQDPGSNSEIKTFCEKRFGVTFPLSEKVSVKGDDIDPLFKYLTEAPNPDFTGEIKWNFEKFLIDENGNLIHRFRSATTPLSPEITKYL
ncbi:glutathione peroxidase [Mucilaginibacter sp. BJC16-A38]|uniref:glutathione peroxidase n=1 Tax=Mucilaginibacter phenanthrenivorans TaxID=1234842 RepID=UPI0021586793|nr:glutathione peroxidase [Mucilaginibacter phenanthrenivorans]MCR8560835.1 glutathione peroxidase [Mucilaginibacter phenanthrenivorans]